jgi:hypothetical protein
MKAFAAWLQTVPGHKPKFAGASFLVVFPIMQAILAQLSTMRVLNILHSPFSLDHTAGGAYIP